MAVTPFVIDDAADAAFAAVIEKGDLLLNICSAAPATYAEATSTYMLAQSPTITDSDFTIGDGAVSGRKCTFPAIVEAEVINDGDSACVALTYAVGSELLFIAPCTVATLYDGNSVSVTALDWTIPDPAAA